MKTTKLGYQAPKNKRINSGFMTIEVEDFHYCSSHKFWYDIEEQDELLHMGKPCFHTDVRLKDSKSNSYRRGSIGFWRYNGISLKSAIRRINKSFNLPKGILVSIISNYSGKYNFIHKIKRENRLEVVYEVSKPSFFDIFLSDDKARELTRLLRDNGFLVRIKRDDEAEVAIAYGHGLRVGFSSNNDPFYGYHQGENKILFDKWDHFDKWSKCNEIPKETTNEEILNILMANK